VHYFGQLLQRELADPAGPNQYRRMAVKAWRGENGEFWSWTSACFSDSDGTQNMITSVERRPVRGRRLGRAGREPELGVLAFGRR
jgi:hypothetical protein